jgi:hypothetical protein
MEMGRGVVLTGGGGVRGGFGGAVHVAASTA